MTRTALIRMLVKRGLDKPAEVVALAEAYYSAVPRVHRVVARAVAIATEAIPRLVAEEHERIGQ